jgi:predicted negative regulator of RcsB-dependent stress response
VLETALEVIRDPGRRYALQCTLARSFAVAGDAETARSRLAGCEPRPANAQLLSLRRLADGAIALAEGRYAAALEVLDQPIDRELATTTAELRIETLERLGRTREAVAALRAAYLQRADVVAYLEKVGFGRATLRRVRRLNGRNRTLIAATAGLAIAGGIAFFALR